MRLLKNITISIMTLLYLTAGLGYGLHICKSDGSVTPLIMIKDASCESVHDHSHQSHSHHDQCSSGHSSDCQDEGGCCHTDVYQITDSYNAVASFQIEQPSELLLPIALLNGVTLDYIALSSDSEVALPEYSPPESIPDSFHSLISVWRL